MNELGDLLRYHHVVYVGGISGNFIPWTWYAIQARQERVYWEGKEKLSNEELIKGMVFV